MPSINHLVFLTVLSLSITACGGGGGSDASSTDLSSSPTFNHNDNSATPTTDIPTSQEVHETPASPELTSEPNTTDETNSENSPIINTDTTGVSSTPVALYAYTNDINSALPLEGASLEPRTVYIFWQGTDISSATFYCCKGVGGEANGENHNPAVSSNGAPFGIALDMSQYSTQGTRELYVDYLSSDGVLHTNNFTYFTITTDDPSPSENTYTVNAILNWNAPQFREDGDALAEDDIASYEITYTDPDGQFQVERVIAPTTSWPTILREGNYQFAISSIDTYGVSSDLSNAITCNIHPAGSSCY